MPMLTIILILPLLIAAFLAVFLRKFAGYIKYIALAASILSLLLIANVNYNQVQSTTWFSISGYSFVITTSTLPLNMLLLLIVGIMTPLIVLYSVGFMNVPSEQPRYYFELCMFATSMMLFAMAGDFITMFIGWELLGITSYLLIGFWYRRNGTADAARKAITTIIIGDIMMLAAMLIIWSSYHTLVFAQLLQQASISNGSMTVALILVIIAVFTKSAQFPFHEWLPDAMKGPTPVSAFLHSSTMVKAGVFLAAVLLPLFLEYHLLYLLLIFGVITAVIGATNALTEHHVKRVLAYSTIEDLGLMFAALGLGSLLAAMMLFVVQTFYKALLFMSAGVMIKANGSEEEMDMMYNSRKYLLLLVPTAIGVLSLAGMYPLSGFFGKAAVDVSATNLLVYVVLLAIGIISNVYIFRWLFIPMHKKTDKKMRDTMKSYRNTPVSMMLPIYILAILAATTGFAIFHYLPIYLNGYHISGLQIGIIEILISIAVTAIGFTISYFLFYAKDYPSLDSRSVAYKLLYNSMLVNSAYVYLTKAVNAVSKAIDSFDYAIYSLLKEGAHNVNSFGNLLKKVETGNTNLYIAIFLIGMAIIIAVFVL